MSMLKSTFSKAKKGDPLYPIVLLDREGHYFSGMCVGL